MCGIAAHFSYRGAPIDAEALLRVRDAMQTRGPDDEGLWISQDQQVGLAHRRLSIIDLSSAGAQPMRRGHTVISFNGEIYNYQRLKHELIQKGYTFTSDSDTEVILHLYAEEGQALVHRLRGMFAFALWDERRQGLFLARDPYGIKPLYYADDGFCVRVASQVKALLKAGDIDTKPEPAGHAGFFLWGHVPEPYTLYREIRALPAGHTAWIERTGRFRTTRYAGIADVLAQAASSDSIAENRAVHLRDALLDAVKAHFVADVPVGVFLSSGIDSSVVVALAREQGEKVNSVTLGFEEYRNTPHDEVPLAETLAQHYSTEHQTIWVTREAFQTSLDRILMAMDQPTVDGVNTFFVSQAATQAGLKVALSGVGGDELFAGYPSFRDVPKLVKTISPALGRLGVSIRKVSAPLIGWVTSPKYAGVFEYGSDFGGAYLLRRALYMPWELPSFLDRDLVREGLDTLAPRLHLNVGIQHLGRDQARVTALESSWYMRNQLLRDTDWASMAHSVEVRTPLVDYRLLEALAPLLAGPVGLSKRKLAQSARPPLPASILSRPKTGFTVPIRDWLSDNQEAYKGHRGLRGWAHLVYNAFVRS